MFFMIDSQLSNTHQYYYFNSNDEFWVNKTWAIYQEILSSINLRVFRAWFNYHSYKTLHMYCVELCGKKIKIPNYKHVK